MTYKSADQLVAENSDTNTIWETRLDYDLVQEILGRTITLKEWADLVDSLDDIVFETVMSLAYGN
jgi:hypothetical protein